MVDFIYIGLGRSGSTFLYEQLRKVENVALPSIKELNYFNDNYDKGDSWYLKQFGSHGPEKIKGELSNKYIYSKECAGRIFKSFPHVKILVTLRNPYDYIKSVYFYRLRSGELPSGTTFVEALEAQPDILERCEYSKLLRPYLHYFGSELLIMNFDELEENPEQFISTVCDFIGCSIPSHISIEKVNSGSSSRSAVLTRITRIGADTLRRLELFSLLQRLKDSKFLRSLVFKRIDSKLYGEIDFSIIKVKLNNEIDHLSVLLKTDYSNWKK